SADQERIDGDEVHADGSTDDTRSGVDRGRGIERCGVTGELATSASTDIETFPIEAGSFIDRLRRGRDDEVGGLGGNRRKSGDGNAEQKNTCRHLSLLGSRSGHHYLRRSVVTIAWTPTFP